MPGVPGYPTPMSQAGSISAIPQNSYPWGAMTGPWRQYGKDGESEDYSWGPNATRAAFIIDVPWTDLERSVLRLLGRPVKSGQAIDRTLPVQHPQFYWLWAKNIARGQMIKTVGVSGPVVEQSKFYSYAAARLTIEFWSPNYAMTANGIGSEWGRFVEWEIEPAGEFLSRPQGTYKWTDGLQNGMTFNGQKNLYLPKKRIKAIWHQVPEQGLFPSLTAAAPNFNSANLDDAVGKVNDASWAGYPAETILMEAWGCAPEILACNPSNLSIDASFKISRVWTVFMSLLQFDPPPGGAQRGHNLFPQNDGLWYPVVSVGGAEKPYKTYDFTKPWKMN